MKRIFITGASGFVGANLLRRLVNEGHEVHALLRRTSSLWRIEDLQQHFTPHHVSLTDTPSLTALLSKLRPEWVFHLAAAGAYPTQDDKDLIFQTNLTGTLSLLQATSGLGVQAFVHAGSSSEYGPKPFAPAEDCPIAPDTDYGVSKAAASLSCQLWASKRQLPTVTLRLYSVYGPWEEPSRLIPTLVQHARRGSLPPLADKHTARDFIYVDEVVDAFLLAAEKALSMPGNIFNIGTGLQSTMETTVSSVIDVFDLHCAPQWNTYPARIWDTKHWVANTFQANKLLGWQSCVSLTAGLREFRNWYELREPLAPTSSASK